MSSILLNNFQSQPQILTAKPNVSTGRDIKFITGFSVEKEPKEARLDLISNVISSILISDKIFIPVYDLPFLLDALKIDAVLKLLRSGTLEVVDDRNLRPTIITENDKDFAATCLFLANPEESGHDTLADIEEKWVKNKLLDKNSMDQLNLLLQKKMASVDTVKISSMIDKELDYDLQNNNITSRMRTTTTSRKLINPNDFYKILRLLHINKGLVYASMLGIDTTLLDSEIQPILNDKVAPIFAQRSTKPVEVFENLIDNKGLPNFGYIFDKGIISIDDILSLRDNVDGILFRKWYASTDYDPQAVLRMLLNKVESRLQGIAVKHTRWIYPKLISLINPVAGIATSYVESFIVDRILKGWHPSFFLDNRLKSEIDKKINEYEKQKILENIRNKFPNIGRNDLCPCRSGRKFKKCCGK